LNTINQLLEEIETRNQIIEELQGRSKSSKSVILTGDMHVGHKFAVGGELESINNFWFEARDRLLKPRANVFVINGEPIDGDNKRELGAGVWTTELDLQVEKANELLEYYKMDQIAMTRGSNYHTTKDNTGFEQLLANRITCAPMLDYKMFGGIKTEKVTDWDKGFHHRIVRIDDILALRAHNVIFNIIHHVGGSKWFAYATTAIARELAQMVFLDGKLWTKEDSPRIVVRAHTHKFVMVKFAHTAAFVSPAWKVTDRFQLKNGLDAATIGLIEVVIEQNGEFTVNDITLENTDYPKINIVDI